MKALHRPPLHCPCYHRACATCAHAVVSLWIIWFQWPNMVMMFVCGTETRKTCHWIEYIFLKYYFHISFSLNCWGEKHFGRYSWLILNNKMHYIRSDKLCTTQLIFICLINSPRWDSVISPDSTIFLPRCKRFFLCAICPYLSLLLCCWCCLIRPTATML